MDNHTMETLTPEEFAARYAPAPVAQATPDEDFLDIDPARIRAELEKVGIVNGELVNPELLAKAPFIQQVERDVAAIAKRREQEERTYVRRLYIEALAEVWDNDKNMIDHCMYKTAELVRLDNGFIIDIEKHRIETDFCFGYTLSHYDSEDYDRANRMVEHAMSSADYFKAKNMEPFAAMLAEFDDDQKILVFRRHYYGQSAENPLYMAQFVKPWEILTALGGSAHMDALPGSTIEMNGQPVYIGTEADKAALRAGYERAMKAHEKKVDAYLKRYGTSKVHAWSYWVDA